MRSVARARPQMTVKHDWSPVVCLAAAVVVSAVFLFVVFRRRRKEIMPECVLPNGLMINHLRKAETDLLFGEIFKGDCYKLPDGDPDMEVMSIHLEPGDVVVDVGANIGMFAIWAAQHEQVAGKVRVLSFECVPSTYSVLEKNAQRYSQGQCRLEAFAYGLSDAERTEVIYHHPNFSIWSTSKCDMDGARDAMLKENLPHLAARASARADLPAALRWLPAAVFRQLVCWGGARVIAALNKVEAIQCRFRRLSDAVFTESGVERVALLKIDVEGAELDVLRGIDAAHVRGTLLSILHTCRRSVLRVRPDLPLPHQCLAPAAHAVEPHRPGGHGVGERCPRRASDDAIARRRLRCPYVAQRRHGQAASDQPGQAAAGEENKPKPKTRRKRSSAPSARVAWARCPLIQHRHRMRTVCAPNRVSAVTLTDQTSRLLATAYTLRFTFSKTVNVHTLAMSAQMVIDFTRCCTQIRLVWCTAQY